MLFWALSETLQDARADAALGADDLGGRRDLLLAERTVRHTAGLESLGQGVVRARGPVHLLEWRDDELRRVDTGRRCTRP